MADPISPNFTPGNGARLVTDRYDFQDHVTGANFRHNADIIVLSPAISVNGGPASSDLQEVLTQINALVPQVVPDATSSSTGLIQLAGDLAAGTATSPVVTGIRGFPIQNTTPNSGDVLTWTGSFWTPQALTSTFSTLTVSGLTTLNGSVNGTGLATLTGGVIITDASFNVRVPSAIQIMASTALSFPATSGRDVNIYADDDILLTNNIATAGSGSDINISSKRNTNISGGAGGTGALSLTSGGFGITIDQSLGTNVVVGDLVLQDGLTVGSTSVDSMTVNSTTIFQNGVTIGSSSADSLIIKSTIGGSSFDTVVQGAFRFINSAGRLLLPGIILNNANQTVSVINNKFLKIPSTVTAARTYTLTATSPQDGDWFRMYNESSFIHLVNGIISDILGVGAERFYVRIGGVWTLVAAPT